VVFSALLILSISAVIYGVKQKEHVKGQVAVIVGVVVWLICGFMGLGTGA
jgi:hypothetical protein